MRWLNMKKSEEANSEFMQRISTVLLVKVVWGESTRRTGKKHETKQTGVFFNGIAATIIRLIPGLIFSMILIIHIGFWC